MQVQAEPGIRREFLLQLPRTPAGIAQRDQRLLRAVIVGDRLEYVARGGEADLGGHVQRRLPVPAFLAPVQDETAIGLHRAAGQHRLVVVVHEAGNLQVLEDIVEAQLERPVHDDAHRAVLVVLAQIGDAVREDGILHPRHRDQEMVAQPHVHGRIVGPGAQ